MRKERIFWGLVFILAAVFLIVGKLGYFGGFSLVSVLFTVFLAAVIIKSVYPVNFPGILFPVAFLCIIYDKPLGIESLTPWTVLLVATLGSVGLSLLFQKNHRYCHTEFQKEAIHIEGCQHITEKTRFGATVKYINSEDFKSANLDCSFGSMSVYFDKAKIPSGEAVINIHASFSGIELFIPKEWDVDNQMQVSLGAVDQKNQNKPDGTTILRLVGTLSLGGIEIMYV